MNLKKSTLYLRADSSRNFKYAVSYIGITKNDTNLLLGAYFGYCGGGIYDGGFFIVVPDQRSYELVSYDEADNSIYSEEFSALIAVSGGFSSDENPSECTDKALALLEEVDDEDGDLIYQDSVFDGDALSGLSEAWGISLRFYS